MAEHRTSQDTQIITDTTPSQLITNKQTNINKITKYQKHCQLKIETNQQITTLF
mgnify:FL=1